MRYPQCYRSTTTRGPQRERGVIAIVVALALAVLIGFAGLALDLGKLYVTKSELQNSADACALAAARDLTGATPLSVSEAAGIAAGHFNSALFQSVPVNMVVDSSVTYSTSSSGPFLDKSAITGPIANIKYVQCSTALNNIANWFIQVLNSLPGVNVAAASVSARAVATTSPAQTVCAIPVFMCMADPSNPKTEYPLGTWLTSKLDSTNLGTIGPGNFGYADLSGGSSANQISGQLSGSGQCNLPAIGSSIGSPGNKTSAVSAWNTRFGVYGNGAKVPSAGNSTGIPDFTGFAYTSQSWSAGSNAYNDFVNQRKLNQPFSNSQMPSGQSVSGTILTSTQYQQLGADRRLALSPWIDCSALAAGGHTAAVQGWACVLMLTPMQHTGNADTTQLEFRGLAGDPGSPCATQGGPGGSNANGPLVPVLVQ